MKPVTEQDLNKRIEALQKWSRNLADEAKDTVDLLCKTVTQTPHDALGFRNRAHELAEVSRRLVLLATKIEALRDCKYPFKDD